MIIATIIALIVLAALTVFQMLLIAGRPLGEYAWGGQHKVLPRNLRIGSVTSIVLYLTIAAFFITKAGLAPIVANPQVVDAGMWVITVYSALGIILNGISRSKKERAVMTPTVIVLAVCSLIVTLG